MGEWEEYYEKMQKYDRYMDEHGDDEDEDQDGEGEGEGEKEKDEEDEDDEKPVEPTEPARIHFLLFLLNYFILNINILSYLFTRSSPT